MDISSARMEKAILLTAICTASFLAFVPYLRWNVLVGWDTPLFLYYIHYVEESGIQATLTSGVVDRPFYAIFLHLFYRLGAPPEQLLKAVPSVFAALYVVSTYLLSKRSLNDSFLASIAALFSSCSLVLMRLADELHSQLLALSLATIAMWLHLLYIDHGSRRYVISIAAITTLLLGIHPFTYGMYIFVLVLSFFIARSITNSEKRKREKISIILCLLPMLVATAFLALTSFDPLIKVFESLVNPRIVSPVTSRTQLENAVIRSISLSVFSALGIIALSRAEGVFRRILLAWTALSLILGLAGALLSLTVAHRFILILPLPILAAYGFRHWRPRRFHRDIRILTFAALISLNISTCVLAQLFFIRPWISEETKQELVWVKENLGDKLVIPVYPLDTSKGYWVLGLIGNYLYYGEVLPLLARTPESYSPYPNLDTGLYWEMLEEDGVLENLSEYKVVLVGGVYQLGIVDERMTTKIDGHDIHIVENSVLTNESEISKYYQIWRGFKDTKIAVIGQEWWNTRQVLQELWIPSVPTWIAPSPNIEYLGSTELPRLASSSKYDVLILANWQIAQDALEADRLLGYFNDGCAIVASSRSIYELHSVSPQVVEFIFGLKKVYPPDAYYSNITYSFQHFVTSSISIPFNGTGAEYGVPVSDLIIAQGIATVTLSEELYLLVVNPADDTRSAHFGLEISDMSEDDVIVFKNLLLWTLHFEVWLE